MLWNTLSNNRQTPRERKLMPDSQFAHQRSNATLNEPSMQSSSPKIMNLVCMSGATSISGSRVMQ